MVASSRQTVATVTKVPGATFGRLVLAAAFGRLDLVATFGRLDLVATFGHLVPPTGFARLVRAATVRPRAVMTALSWQV